ncbi:MAG: hypothetical protein IT340_20165 [Chloroflexi bacterium]|nr:hypothetical protein [Chloroflexota bacterium]
MSELHQLAADAVSQRRRLDEAARLLAECAVALAAQNAAIEALKETALAQFDVIRHAAPQYIVASDGPPGAVRVLTVAEYQAAQAAAPGLDTDAAMLADVFGPDPGAATPAQAVAFTSLADALSALSRRASERGQ